jgi:hypothetical protein
MYEKYTYSVDVTNVIAAHRKKINQIHYTRVHQMLWHSDYSTPAFVTELA